MFNTGKSRNCQPERPGAFGLCFDILDETNYHRLLASSNCITMIAKEATVERT